MTIVVDELGRVTLPKEALQALNLHPGDELETQVQDGQLILHSKHVTQYQMMDLPEGVRLDNGLLVWAGEWATTSEDKNVLESFREERLRELSRS
jgi:AbrB family looped-hinge helix DNA binding protein